METNDESSLLHQAQAGEVEAFGELCRIYETRLLRQAIAFGCQISCAEDLVQETLVEAWKNLRRYNGSCRFFTWLCAILLNRHRSLLRRGRFPALVSLLSVNSRGQSDHVNQIAAPQPLPDELAQLQDEALVIRKCIAALPARHRQVVYLRFYSDDSLEGIAAALGCRIGTVKSRLFHALEKLRRMKALTSPIIPSRSSPSAELPKTKPVPL